MPVKFEAIERTSDLRARVKYELTDDPTMGVYVAHVQVTRPLEDGSTEVLLGTPPAAKEPLTPFDVSLIASLLLGRLVYVEGEPTKLYWGAEPFSWVSFYVLEGETQKT